jgi:enhancing lycopene biosynthesis protein 2
LLQQLARNDHNETASAPTARQAHVVAAATGDDAAERRSR